MMRPASAAECTGGVVAMNRHFVSSLSAFPSQLPQGGRGPRRKELTATSKSTCRVEKSHPVERMRVSAYRSRVILTLDRLVCGVCKLCTHLHRHFCLVVNIN